MRRRWPLALALVCAALVAFVAARPASFRRVVSVSEFDRSRSIQERYLGLVTWVRAESDPRLDVAGDLRREMARRGLTLPVSIDGPCTRVLEDGRVQYHGNIAARRPKEAVDAAARLLDKLRRRSDAYVEEVSGRTHDGGATLSVFFAKGSIHGMLNLSFPAQPSRRASR